MNARDVAIVGVGMTNFGKHQEIPLKNLAKWAIDAALQDSGYECDDIDMAFVANAMASVITGEVSVVGQGILRANGFNSIPVYNIDNACAGSSSALNLAVQSIRSGAAQTILVLGVEKLFHEDRMRAYVALNGAVDLNTLVESGIAAGDGSVFVKSIYPQRFERYAARHGLDVRTLAAISVKNRKHAAQNPYAQFKEPLTEEMVLGSRSIVGPLTALMCAPISDGAGALIVTSRPRVSAHQRPIWIRGSKVGMGNSPGSGISSIRRVAEQAYQEAGISSCDIDLAEVHDSISFNEMLAYEELGFCEPGKGGALVASGDTAIGGRIPVNTSGGLESRGHPVAATGAAQIVELVEQLRGNAGARQVRDARLGLAENAGGFAYGDTAAIAVTILEA